MLLFHVLFIYNYREVCKGACMDWNNFNELKILLVDDDRLTRELGQTILEQVPNITIHQASNGKEALNMLEDITYDLILLDLYMPEMDGREFATTFKKNTQFNVLPVVLMTTDRLSLKELKELDVEYYLTKPFNFQTFLSDIYGFLEKVKVLNET
ncbi:MAG: Unknown protein [uncultured Sulfurovum sp.]|uniref:Response regulatory domain-containing protein n=1 Tax=uncultured Sulfurovum sp. TaxID=269237 RepID=A0A6S6U2I1_9BACT|nr:MAG: Unknown protein [uncultured Sulfurovum sp.]